MSKQITQEQLEHIIRIGALERYWVNNFFIAIAGNYQIFKDAATALHVPQQSARYVDHKFDKLRGLSDGYPVFLLPNWSLVARVFAWDKLKELEARGSIRLIELTESDLNPVIPDVENLSDSELRIARKQAIWSTFAKRMQGNEAK